MVKCLHDLSIFTVFLKNKKNIFKIRSSKVTDYAALMFVKVLIYQEVTLLCTKNIAKTGYNIKIQSRFRH